MTDTQSRRPSLVPGPAPQAPPSAQGGIAARAVAMREQATAPEIGKKAEQGIPYRNLPLPVTGVGNIAKGITGVMTEVGTIEKGGFNKFHNYYYARLDDLLKAITPLMGKHGIAVIQNEVSKETIENRMAVTYEFSILHTSGETWPERPRFTGMAMGRDSKGNLDDKAINKCHSAARKYFLLSLFQVPTGDFDDADAGPPAPAQEQRREPPAQQARERVPSPSSPVPPPEGPREIIPGPGAGAEGWARAYAKAIQTAKSVDELTQWDALNSTSLETIYANHRPLYDRIDAITQEFISRLEGTPDTLQMPDPKQNTREAMEWVAQGLVDAPTYEAAELFWNTMVAPREKEFEPMDWELLMAEWKRAEARLAKPAEQPVDGYVGGDPAED